MTKIKNNDNNIMMDSSNKPKNLATNSNQAKDERPSSQVDRPSSSSVTVRPESSADGNSSNTDTINEMPTRDRPT